MKNELETYHKIYSAVHYSHKLIPQIWTDHECNRILSATMAGKQFSWRVIGITPKALGQFQLLDFKYKSRQGFTRAHLKPRIETVRYLLAPDNPYNMNDFYNEWIKNDKTVICARGENKIEVPPFIHISNEDGLLFSCQGKLAGWKHTKNEQN